MLGGSKVTSGHVPLIPLDDEHVGLSSNDPMVGDWIEFQKKEPLAHLKKKKWREMKRWS